MRFLRLLLLLGLVASLRAQDPARPATADEIALFKDALKNTTQDTERWAYTETTTMKSPKGKVREETVVRFDPSKPWPEQYTPLKIEGKPPTERQLKKYRERGEKRGVKLTSDAARAAEAAADPTQPGPIRPRAKEKGTTIKLDLEHPRVLREADGLVIFEVPLVASDKDIPVDKFEVHVTVDRVARQVRHAAVRLRESFRLKLIAKVKAGEASVDFAVVDPQYGPVMTSATGSFGVSVMLVPVSGTFSNTRTDWQRVKPYNDRLKVKLGPLELLDF
jgi:hypothetical protein